MPVVSLAQLLESGVHFGHQTRRWNPKMDTYIYTSRNGVHIIDLVQTARLMDEAYNYVRTASEQGKKFLFIGTKRQAAGIVAQEASRCGAYYVNQRWLGGMLTNWTTIKTRVDRLKDLERREATGGLDLLPKKEASVLRRELEKLQKYLGGIKAMRKVPRHRGDCGSKARIQRSSRVPKAQLAYCVDVRYQLRPRRGGYSYSSKR